MGHITAPVMFLFHVREERKGSLCAVIKQTKAQELYCRMLKIANA
jgi:hypothetical protein